MTDLDPVLLEIVEGTLASIEAEVEDQIGRTSRSPMIRDQHDFRAGIHDRRLRKLTGRSYSALVHPIVRDFSIDTMRPGDVYFHNDVYLSEGGIGHLPDLCVTVPVFHVGEVVAFVQAFGHHDDIGGAVPGSMPSHATSVFEEGLMVPPVKLYAAGVPNEGVIRILTRNSRMPDSIAGDLDAECSACLMGAARLADLFARYGRPAVEACFDGIVAACAETFRRELLAKIPDGTWAWEDYAEHDGVDEPRLHRQRITLTKTTDKLVLDLSGTGRQAKGPINHAGDYADGNFLKKWLAPILRNLADTPERMAELDVNEGVVELIDIRFPPPGTLVTPVFPAPTNARTFVILRLLGVLAGVIAKAVDGYMPADQETIRYTGIAGHDVDGRWYLNREILGGGSGGRYYADGSDTVHVVPESRNLPVEFVETRFPVRVESLGLATDSGGAGTFRGGLGYRKAIRALHDASFMSVADRSILSCWGVRGGKAGTPFRVTIDPGGPAERRMPGLCDWESVAAGEVIRIETTGGGGWGDPLEREPWRVALDVRQGKVSPTAARDDYGVVFVGGTGDPGDLADGRADDLPDDPVVDDRATAGLRARLAARRGKPAMFDRGPGYPILADGASHAEVDGVSADAVALPVPADAWQRHGFGGAPADLGPAGTLPRAWSARWAAAPGAPTLAGPDGRWVSAAELEERTAAVAARYAAAGLMPGDRLLVSAPASVELGVAHVAALRLGLVVVPVNTAFGPAEIGVVAAAAEPALAVLDDPARLPGVPSTGVDVALPDGPTPALDVARPDDTALLVFTSGTTGVPKGVPLAHANLLATSASIEVAWRWTADDRLVLALPLFHLHGLGVGLHGTLLAGASAVILPRFDVDAVLDAVAATRATLMFGVPTMWVRLAASPRLAELGALRLSVSGSAPLDPSTFEALAAGVGSPVLERYGMTETGMLVSNPYEGERRAGSVGLALPGVEVRLEERAGAGEPAGEIMVRGPNVFGGYLGGVGADAFAADGWFRTGDLGRADPDGYLRIVGRSKELIITGGFNVYPRDVEEVLRRHPGVADVAVVGVPDPEWGERVVACVVAAGTVDARDLLAWAAERLAAYKRPREVRFVDELPRNALGKVVRSALLA